MHLDCVGRALEERVGHRRSVANKIERQIIDPHCHVHSFHFRNYILINIKTFSIMIISSHISYFIVHLFINLPSHLLLSRRPIHFPLFVFSSFEKLSPKWRAVSYGGGDIATCAYLGRRVGQEIMEEMLLGWLRHLRQSEFSFLCQQIPFFEAH